MMALEDQGETFKITFSDLQEQQKISGVFQDGNYVETIVENGNSSEQVTIQQGGLLECLEEGYESLPWALQLFCVAACGAIWTGVGLAACAGCLTGLGINCD